MKIEINNHRKVYTLKEEFNSSFFNLKIEFYKKPGKPDGPPSKKFVGNRKSLVECRAVHNSGFIPILSGMTVGELKQNFNDVYGLAIGLLQNQDSSYEGTPGSEITILEETNSKAA